MYSSKIIVKHKNLTCKNSYKLIQTYYNPTKHNFAIKIKQCVQIQTPTNSQYSLTAEVKLLALATPVKFDRQVSLLFHQLPQLSHGSGFLKDWNRQNKAHARMMAQQQRVKKTMTIELRPIPVKKMQYLKGFYLECTDIW